MPSNFSQPATTDLPPLPEYTLSPLPPLVTFLSDFWLLPLLPIVAYWALSLVFHLIDVYDVFPQYRLHTPAEITKRNHVSRYEVARDVIIQQVIQVGVGALLSLTEPEEMYGREAYDVAWWAQTVRIGQKGLPRLLSLLGINAAAISRNVSGSHPMIAAALAGGQYPFLMSMEKAGAATVPAFANWEIMAAKAIYWYIVPILQFAVAIVVLDTWQYFLHRAMHMNRWLYSMWPALTFLLASDVISNAAFPSPSTLCAICIWRFVQSPRRGLPTRHGRRKSGV